MPADSTAGSASDQSRKTGLPRRAAALGYDSETDAAPRLLAKGAGEVADRIIALAKEHGIPIREDRDLVAVLARLDLDQEIPPELYKAVAELLAFVYRVNSRWKEAFPAK
jgi:flagellar biosynthesis protein